MLYNHPRKEEPITQQEAVEISYKHGTISTASRAQEIVAQWGRRYDEAQFDGYCMLSAVYMAGYIKGKQDERARKRYSKKEYKRLYNQ